MFDGPETHYAWNGGVSLAYQVVGDGPIDLLYLQGFASHVDLNWQGPALARFLRGLSQHARLIVTDRRGWGCSDRFSPFDVAPLETITEDLAIVLEAAGSKRAVVFGTQECGINAALFAANDPERTRGLILADSIVTYDGLGGGSRWNETMALLHEQWGRRAWAADWPDARERAWFDVYARSAIPPGGLIAECERYRYVDPRPIYPTVHVPTLILATVGDDPIASEANGRYLAAAIPGARLVQQPAGHPFLHWYARSEQMLAEVGRFLGSLRDDEALLRRMLATVLFTDIVRSTEHAARLGDAEWRDLLERHHRLVRSIVARYGGNVVDTAGDGFFATFEGPGRAIRAAQSIVGAVATLGLEVRAGLHTGECEIMDGKPSGVTVNVGARIAALAPASSVLVSDTVRSLVAGSPLRFRDRGTHALRGIPDEWRLWEVADLPA